MPFSPSGTERFFLNFEKSAWLVLLILIFLTATKIPSALDSDIQPWDEGMYAARVNSILINGDFIDQSLHSVGRFYSGSHPPALIWLGYFFSIVFGFNPVSLKLLMLIISLLSVFMIYLIGKDFLSRNAGIFAALIFSGNILFNVFSRRFQLDMPYVLFMVAAFYFVLKISSDKRKSYAYLAGIFFGVCLMSKILVGLIIPLVILSSIIVYRHNSPISVRDLIVITLVGLLIAMPWHVYMYMQHGAAFTDYFFGFHLIERALTGVEMNEKASGPLYYFNYLLTIFPYGVLLLFALINNFRNIRTLKFPVALLWIWTICGFIIITLFKTKLESYLLLVLPAVSLLIAEYLSKINIEEKLIKAFLLSSLILNILWYASENYRPVIKNFVAETGIILSVALLIAAFAVTLIAGYYLQNKFNTGKIIGGLIVLSFLVSNIFYLFRRPLWEDRFHIKNAVNVIESSGVGGIVYIGSDYRFNPQFSYYFNGIDLGWKDPKYEYEFMDTNVGNEKVKAKLNLVDKSKIVFVERDKINRAEYPPAELFIPRGFKMLHKETGYEIYRRESD